MKIRKATLQDIEKIAYIEFFSGYRWRVGKREELKEAERILSSRLSNVYILENKNKEIAYFVITFKKKVCYINFFSVIKHYQKKGVGSRLMKRIINIARKKNCKKIEVNVWAKNFPAIALYNKFGFYVRGIKRKYYPNGDDRLRMKKRLR